MNCQQFQSSLDDFLLEGSEEGRVHRAECFDCHRLAEQSEVQATTLTAGLQLYASQTHVTADFRQRVLHQLEREMSPKPTRSPWVLALAACLTVCFLGARWLPWGPGPPTTHHPLATAEVPHTDYEMVLQLTYSAPAHRFRQQGDQVADSLGRVSVTLDQRIPVQQSKEAPHYEN